MKTFVGAMLCATSLVIAVPASADDIPKEPYAFTAYVQNRLQLYSPKPVVIKGDFDVTWTTASGDFAVSNFQGVFLACQRDPAGCEHAIDAYVSEASREIQDVGATPAPAQPADNTLFPSDDPGFLAYVVKTLNSLMPGSKVSGDEYTLTIVRPAGPAMTFDVRSLHDMCRMLQYRCAPLMADHLPHMAAILVMPDPARLHIDLRAAPGYSIRWDQPTAWNAKPAFANIQERCVKETKEGRWPLLNADSDALDLGFSDAIALCEKDTRAALAPIDDHPAADGIGVIKGPDVSAHALFADDWAQLLSQSGGHLLMSVPTRDTLLFMKGDGDAEIAEIAARTQQIYASLPSAGVWGMLGVENDTNDDHRVSTDVYRWNGDRWAFATSPRTKTIGPVQTLETLP